MMTITSQLADYIATHKCEDLNHTIFPNRQWADVASEMEQLAQQLVPLVNDELDRHLNSLHIPSLAEVQNTQIMSVGFPVWLAQKLDELNPDWNIVQKAIFYGYYLQEAWKAATREFEHRVKEKQSQEGQRDASHAIIPPDAKLN